MALTERVEIGSREVLSDGVIQVRTDTVIERDGVEIDRLFHRHIVVPGDDTTKEDASVRVVADAVHTPEVIENYLASLATRSL